MNVIPPEGYEVVYERFGGAMHYKRLNKVKGICGRGSYPTFRATGKTSQPVMCQECLLKAKFHK